MPVCKSVKKTRERIKQLRGGRERKETESERSRGEVNLQEEEGEWFPFISDALALV